MACAQDNENQSSDETYISKEDFLLLRICFQYVVGTEMQFFQIPFLAGGRGWLQTGAAPSACWAGRVVAGRERLLPDCCALTNRGSFSTCRHTGCLRPGCAAVSWVRLSPKEGGWDPCVENGRGHSRELRQHITHVVVSMSHTLASLK